MNFFLPLVNSFILEILAFIYEYIYIYIFIYAFIYKEMNKGQIRVNILMDQKKKKNEKLCLSS